MILISARIHTHPSHVTLTHTLHTYTHTNTNAYTLFQDLRKSVGQIQSTLVKKLSILDKYEHVLAQVNAVAMERLIDPKTQVNILDVCADPVVMAQQLTHIETVRERERERERDN